MYWQNLNDFLAMGGYGFYVWGSYAVAAGCIAVEGWALLTRSRRAKKLRAES